MPRGRGGQRQGKQGVAYSNRTDLNERRLPTGQPYGARQALEAFQQSGPTPQPSPLPAGQGGGSTPAGPPPAPIDIFAPTERPGEPITAGIPLGAGPTGQPPIPPDPHLAARALYQRAVDEGWPYADDLRRMLEQAGG